MASGCRIAHLTSVHPRDDIRIFSRECRTLSEAGYDVTLLVADGQGEARVDGIRIVDAGASHGRLSRMLGAPIRLAKSLDRDTRIVHLHDPELLPMGLYLRRRGHIVVFDAHEDLPKQILVKPYLAPAARAPLSAIVGGLERLAVKGLDHVVAATPAIRDKFLRMGVAATAIANYPLEDELAATTTVPTRERAVCYVGGISMIRGVREMVAAVGAARSGVRLDLAGRFDGQPTRDAAASTPGWDRVVAHGQMPRSAALDLMNRSLAGLLLFQPTGNHLESQPNKLFEYMAAGLPVIASDFPLWREIVEGHGCGICVRPDDVQGMASAIDRLPADPALVERMGRNGRRLIETRYSWASEKPKLLALYRDLLAGSTGRPFARQSQ